MASVHAVLMTNHIPTHQMAAVLLASSHHGGGTVYWITGWIVVLALIVGSAVYFTRRGRRHAEPDNPTHGQLSGRRSGPDVRSDDRSR
jgi:hypothetical protein